MQGNASACCVVLPACSDPLYLTAAASVVPCSCVPLAFARHGQTPPAAHSGGSHGRAHEVLPRCRSSQTTLLSCSSMHCTFINLHRCSLSLAVYGRFYFLFFFVRAAVEGVRGWGCAVVGDVRGCLQGVGMYEVVCCPSKGRSELVVQAFLCCSGDSRVGSSCPHEIFQVSFFEG